MLCLLLKVHNWQQIKYSSLKVRFAWDDYTQHISLHIAPCQGEHCCPGSEGPGGALSPPPWVMIPSKGGTDPLEVLAVLARNRRGARWWCWKRAMLSVWRAFSQRQTGQGTPWPKQPAAFWVKSELCCAQELAIMTNHNKTSCHIWLQL